MGSTASRFYMDAALEEARRRAAEFANETISSSGMVGGDRHGGGTGERGGVYRRSAMPELDDAQFHSGIAPGWYALAL